MKCWVICEKTKADLPSHWETWVSQLHRPTSCFWPRAFPSMFRRAEVSQHLSDLGLFLFSAASVLYIKTGDMARLSEFPQEWDGHRLYVIVYYKQIDHYPSDPDSIPNSALPVQLGCCCSVGHPTAAWSPGAAAHSARSSLASRKPSHGSAVPRVAALPPLALGPVLCLCCTVGVFGLGCGRAVLLQALRPFLSSLHPLQQTARERGRGEPSAPQAQEEQAQQGGEGGQRGWHAGGRGAGQQGVRAQEGCAPVEPAGRR